MRQANASLTPDDVRAILRYTASSLPFESVLAQGAGLVNAEGAVRVASAVGADGASAMEGLVSQGLILPWSMIGGQAARFGADGAGDEAVWAAENYALWSNNLLNPFAILADQLYTLAHSDSGGSINPINPGGAYIPQPK
jgi:hypothetical protein